MLALHRLLALAACLILTTPLIATTATAATASAPNALALASSNSATASVSASAAAVTVVSITTANGAAFSLADTFDYSPLTLAPVSEATVASSSSLSHHRLGASSSSRSNSPPSHFLSLKAARATVARRSKQFRAPFGPVAPSIALLEDSTDPGSTDDSDAGSGSGSGSGSSDGSPGSGGTHSPTDAGAGDSDTEIDPTVPLNTYTNGPCVPTGMIFDIDPEQERVFYCRSLLTYPLLGSLSLDDMKTKDEAALAAYLSDAAVWTSRQTSCSSQVFGQSMCSDCLARRRNYHCALQFEYCAASNEPLPGLPSGTDPDLDPPIEVARFVTLKQRYLYMALLN